MYSDEALVKEITVLLANADRAMEDQDWPTANDQLKRGLEILGDRYASPDTVDDTGMKLVLADAEERNHALQTAVQIRRKVMATRLALLQRRAGLPPAPPAGKR